MNEQLQRETDRWLRRYALIAPVITLAFGFMGGFITAFLTMRQLQGEVWRHSSWIERTDNRLERIIEFESRVSEKLNIPR